MPNPPDFILNEIIEMGDSQLDYDRRLKLARRIVEYRECFPYDFENDNWNIFELEFLESMDEKIECYGNSLMLTDKQEEVLKRIIERYNIP